MFNYNRAMYILKYAGIFWMNLLYFLSPAFYLRWVFFNVEVYYKRNINKSNYISVHELFMGIYAIRSSLLITKSSIASVIWLHRIVTPNWTPLAKFSRFNLLYDIILIEHINVVSVHAICVCKYPAQPPTCQCYQKSCQKSCPKPWTDLCNWLT